ncbi:MAG TPA: alternative ribosome rescue aminoacyl-tRNA hydrolase ArfB [Anaerolineaceae bacterium]|nr:alternative ribosome rescue aminoacyl-tRNA hydrolase ArfB [Anaerolineaceae bacterium]
MIEIKEGVGIDDSEIKMEFVRSSGPGGQNVNKVATAVQLRFDVRSTTALTDEIKARLERLAGSRMTDDGVLVIDAHRYRTQEQNRADALERFIELIQRALEEPHSRKRTRPTLASQTERVETKKRRGAIKRMRRASPPDLE